MEECTRLLGLYCFEQTNPANSRAYVDYHDTILMLGI